MSEPERGRHRVARERTRRQTLLRVAVVLAVVAALLVLGYFLSPYVVELVSILKQDAPGDGSPLTTITIDVRPDP